MLSDEAVAEELFKILQPFDVATTLLCGEENSTISCTLTVLHGLLQHLGPQEEDSSGITTFKCMVKQEIEERWELNDLDVSSCLVLQGRSTHSGQSGHGRTGFSPIARPHPCSGVCGRDQFRLVADLHMRNNSNFAPCTAVL